jgi:hypothetical protein
VEFGEGPQQKFKAYSDRVLAFANIRFNIGGASFLFVARHTAHLEPGM